MFSLVAALAIFFNKNRTLMALTRARAEIIRWFKNGEIVATAARPAEA
jgi:hypothetical protein